MRINWPKDEMIVIYCMYDWMFANSVYNCCLIVSIVCTAIRSQFSSKSSMKDFIFGLQHRYSIRNKSFHSLVLSTIHWQY